MFTLNLDKLLSLGNKLGAIILGLFLFPGWLLLVIKVGNDPNPVEPRMYRSRSPCQPALIFGDRNFIIILAVVVINASCTTSSGTLLMDLDPVPTTGRRTSRDRDTLAAGS